MLGGEVVRVASRKLSCWYKVRWTGRDEVCTDVRTTN